MTSEIEPFCAWGDGPDVGINLKRTEEQAKGYTEPHLFWALDFTSAQARELAAKLIRCADNADRLEQAYADEYSASGREANNV